MSKQAKATHVIVSLVRRELSIAGRQGATPVQAVVFFAVVITMIPFGLGPDLALLTKIAPGVLWVAFVLASMLTLDRLFQADFEDGSLDVMTLSPLPLEAVVLAKGAAHWLSNVLPLILAAPILALLLNLEVPALAMVVVTLVLGTPGLTFISAIGAALTVGVRRGGLLTALLVLPLFVPILIFAVGAVDAVRGTASGAIFNWLEPNLLFLTAASLVGLVIGPIAAAAALRLNVS